MYLNSYKFFFYKIVAFSKLLNTYLLKHSNYIFFFQFYQNLILKSKFCSISKHTGLANHPSKFQTYSLSYMPTQSQIKFG